MITQEKLLEANKKLETVDLKGKQYVTVTERVKAFRDMCPEGCIETEIIALNNGVVTIKATVRDETGKILGTGLAQEKENNGFVNKTSYVENCETSAVGRAIGFVGIGIDGSMASAEEVANAVLQQQKIDGRKVNAIKSSITAGKVKEAKILEHFNLEKIADMTEGQFGEYTRMLNGKANQ